MSYIYYGKRSEMKKQVSHLDIGKDGQEHGGVNLAIETFGDKWKFKIMEVLFQQGPMRFTAIQKSLSPISPTVLSERLNHLESSGVVVRQQPTQGKPSVYNLGEGGLRARPVMDELEKWGRHTRNGIPLQPGAGSDIERPSIDFALLKKMMTVRKLKKGEYLLREGDVCNFIGFVETGAMRSFLSHDGEEMNNDFYLKDGIVCALTSFLSRRPTNCNIQALADTELALISHERYQVLVDSQLEWLRFAKWVSDSFFMRKCRRETSFLKHSTTEKLVMVRNMFPGIDQIVSQYHIASYMGVRAESLSRSKLVDHQNKNKRN